MDKRLDDLDDAASRPDEESSGLTPEDFRHMRPARESIAEVFGPVVADNLRRGKERPTKPDRKVNLTPRLTVRWQSMGVR
jgi:hypothetical protein